MTKLPFIAGSLLILGACGQEPYDPRGLHHEETLLSVSTTGQAETRPDQAQFQAGINTWEKTAKAASAANLKKIGGDCRCAKAARHSGEGYSNPCSECPALSLIHI